ncbi:MAG: ribosome maturation factor RimM [Candidatus Tyrphobacter sp.]
MRSTSSTARRRRSRWRPTAEEIPVGRIAGCFGIAGELKCDPTQAARSLFVPGATFRYEVRDGEGTVRLGAVREHAGRLLVLLEGVADRTKAQKFAGATLYAPRESVPLACGEFLDADLVGCAVVDVGGRSYGTVERVEHFPASDMLVVGGRMVPMVSAIVRGIDLAGRSITVDPPSGLLED